MNSFGLSLLFLSPYFPATCSKKLCSWLFQQSELFPACSRVSEQLNLYGNNYMENCYDLVAREQNNGHNF